MRLHSFRICAMLAVMVASAWAQAQGPKPPPPPDAKAPEPQPSVPGPPKQPVPPATPLPPTPKDEDVIAPAPVVPTRGPNGKRGKRGKSGAPAAQAERPAVPGQPDAAPGEVAFTRCLKVPPGKKLRWTVKQDAELDDLVGWMSTLTCKTFIVPQNLRSQKVKIISPNEVTVTEAYRLFLSALNTMNLTVIPTGNALEVVETTRVKEGAPVVGTGEGAPNDERYITRLLRVRNVSAAEMGAVLQKLRSKDGDVSWYDPTGTLIITDTAQNAQRMADIVAELDVAGSVDKIWIVKLHNTSATDVAQKLSEIFQVVLAGKGASAAPPGGAPSAPRKVVPESTGTAVESPTQIVVSKIIPDERSNSLIIVASEHAYARIYALIKRLDTSREEAEAVGEGRVHVYALANANADELASTLGSLTGATVSGTTGGARRTRTGQPQTAAPPPPTPTAGGTPGAAGILFEGEVRISPDKPTNSLVILASLKDFLTLKSVIKQLDVPRRQVFIEGAILEVSLDRSRQIGTSFHGGGFAGSSDNQTLIFGGLNPQKTLLPVQSGLVNDLAQGLATGALGPNIPNAGTLFGQTGLSVPSFGVFLKLLATSNDVNVLSTPHILTTDNEEAEIKVGQNVPFQGGFLPGLGGIPGSTGTGTTPGTTPSLGFTTGFSVNRQDVALDLKITPHVNDSGMVRLEVDQEISDIASENFNNLGPITSKRTVKTVVVVKDQQPVVLGGLITDRVTNTVQKVPLLGDIPILGFFFKNTTKKVQKTNLLVFLTPYVISDQSDLKRIFERKWQERREFLERYTAFSRDKDFEGQVDYTHKRGLLEEVNRTAREAEDEQRMLERIRDAEQAEDHGPVELPPGFRPVKTAPSGGVQAPTSPVPGTQPPAQPPSAQPPPAQPPPAQPPPAQPPPAQSPVTPPAQPGVPAPGRPE